MAEESDSDGVGSEDIAEGEILEQLAAVEGNGTDEKVDCACQGSLYLKKKKKGMKKGKKWKFYKCYLQGSSLWYYRPQEANPKAAIELGNKFEMAGEDVLAGESRPHTLAVRKKDGSTTWFLAATSEKNFAAWTTAVEKCFGEDPAKPPTGALKRKSSLIMRAKKKVAGKAATSGVGKRLIKSVMRDDDIDELFVSGKAIVARDKDAKTADKLEDTIIKIAVKGILLLRNGSIEGEKAAPMEPILRTMGKDLKECYNDRIRYKRKPEELEKAAAASYVKIAASANQLDTMLVSLFSPFVTDATIAKIKEVTSYLGDKDTWKRIYENPEQEDDLRKVLAKVSYYLKFY